jgi:response regulator RpfG family c-di-GMP phosphodiesterase
MELSNHKDNYILLVDDEKDVLDLFSEYLTSNSFNTVSFDNPVKALEYFYKNPNNCSLVITDYRMPQMLGLDFINKIREKDTDCKIKMILISAFMKSDLNIDNKLNLLKIDKVIEKPIHLENLKNEVKKLLLN